MYGRIAYTHKTHEKMADILIAKYTWIKRLEIWISALSTSSLIVAIFGDSHSATVIGAAFSTLLLGFVLYFKEATLGERAQLHTETAASLWGIREQLLSMLVDLRIGIAEGELLQRRDSANRSFTPTR